MSRESSKEMGITARVGRLGRLGVLTLLVALVATLLAPLSAVAQDIQPVDAADDWVAPRTVYIPETGHTIDGVFLDYWRASNGIGNFGYPISAEHDHNGVVAQYYTYARFEYHPDDPNGEIVHIANVGEEMRPMPLPRASVAGDVQSASAVIELALMTKAWLPLDESFANRENSETWRYVPETKHSVANGFKSWWEATGESYLGNPLSEEYVLKGVTYQTFERGQLAWKKNNDVWLVPVGEILAKKYNVSTAPVAQGEIPVYDEALFVAPEKPKVEKRSGGNGGERWIEVNLSMQYLIAWEGDVPVAETYVSTGREGFETPAGTFYVQRKLETDLMTGTIGGEYYNVPDVPSVQYFTEGGHAIHGAYWHSNFGAVMSHGCINLPLDFAYWLYGWSTVGTRIEIHY